MSLHLSPSPSPSLTHPVSPSWVAQSKLKMYDWVRNATLGLAQDPRISVRVRIRARARVRLKLMH